MKNRKDFAAEKFDLASGVEGMSSKMLSEHIKLYEGYVKKINEIQTKVDAADKAAANGVYSEFGELKRQETFAVNGMKLHEVYFGLLKRDPSTDSTGSRQASSGQASVPKGVLKEMIEKDWGSLDAWKEEMIATGMSSRGWAILAYDFKDDRLHVYGSDAHNVGAVWNAATIIVLDVYEHAYVMDYGVSRKDYINSFFKNLNWDFANTLVTKYGLDKTHQK